MEEYLYLIGTLVAGIFACIVAPLIGRRNYNKSPNKHKELMGPVELFFYRAYDNPVICFLVGVMFASCLTFILVLLYSNS